MPLVDTTRGAIAFFIFPGKGDFFAGTAKKDRLPGGPGSSRA